MKKAFVITILAVAAQLCYGQGNPRAGYIITHENDTVYGTIDYGTNARNAEVCSFMASGSSGYRRYSATDIKGYRLTDDNIYYVSRTFPVDGRDKTFFAEYLLQGGMSLYYHREGTADLYYFVDEEGRVAVMKKLEGLTDSDHENARIRRETYQDVFDLFGKSGKAQGELWAMQELSPKQLTRITREYNETFCTDFGNSVEYQFQPARPATTPHDILKLSAGPSLITSEMKAVFTTYSHLWGWELKLDYAHLWRSGFGIGINTTMYRAGFYNLGPSFSYEDNCHLTLLYIGPSVVWSKKWGSYWRFEALCGIGYAYSDDDFKENSGIGMLTEVGIEYMVSSHVGIGMEFNVLTNTFKKPEGVLLKKDTSYGIGRINMLGGIRFYFGN